MIHLRAKTRQLPDTGMRFPFPTTNILMYLSGQNETLPWDLSMPTTPLTYDYDPTCCTFSNTTGATTINPYDPDNSSINTGKTCSLYTYDDICDLHLCESRSKDKATYVDSNLHYYGYRYYCPELGRWVSRDPIGISGGINIYEFVANGPVDAWDVNGLWKECQIKLVLGHSGSEDFEDRLQGAVDHYDDVSATYAAVFPLTCFNRNYKDDVGDYKLPNFADADYWNVTLDSANWDEKWGKVSAAIEATADDWCKDVCGCHFVHVTMDANPADTETIEEHTGTITVIREPRAEGEEEREVVAYVVDTTWLYSCRTKSWKRTLIGSPIMPVTE